MSEADRRLFRLASRQYGLATNDQSRRVGMSDAMRRQRVHAGRLISMSSRVLAIAGTPPTWEQQVLAACLHAGPGAVASHGTAAHLWNLAGSKEGRVEVTVPRGWGTRNPLAVVHRGTLAAGDHTKRFGIPVTGPARTLLDYAVTTNGQRLEDAVDDALCRRLTRVTTLSALLAVTGSRGRKGAGELLRLLEVWAPGDRPGSIKEIQVVRRLVGLAIPRPVLQFPVYDGKRFIGRCDAAWPDSMAVLEFDSFRWHAGRRPFYRDKARRRDLVALGYRVLEATDDDFVDGCQRLAAAVKRVLTRAA